MKAAMLLVLGAALVSAQPRYEAASVKVNESGSNAMGGIHGFRAAGGAHIVNFTLKTIIGLAYGLEDYRVLGGPSWISSEWYDIEAKPPAGAKDSDGPAMLQALLAERFELRVHRDARTVPGYRLLAEKGDAKLHRSRAERNAFRFMSMDHIEGPGTMGMLTWVLKAILGAPVLDETGLKAKYDIDITFTPPDAAADNSEFGVSIFTALKQDLGLTLKAAQVPVEVIIVDHALKTPIPN